MKKPSPMKKVYVVKTDFANCGFDVILFTRWELAKEYMRRVVFEDFEREYKFMQEYFEDMPEFPATLQDMTDEHVEAFFNHESVSEENFYDIVEKEIWTNSELIGE